MHSVTLYAIGNLVRDPELKKKAGKAYTRFALISTDYSRRADGTACEQVTSIWLVAFDGVATAIAKHCRAGDQVFVRARVQSSRWERNGKWHYTTSFIVEGVRFGKPGRAKREAFARLSRASSDDLDAAASP